MMKCSMMLIPLLMTSAALAQDKPEDDKDKPPSRVERIVTQPARDVGIEKTKTPELLASAVAQPYASPGKGCRAVVARIAELNEVLGPDFGTNSKENEDKFGNLAAAGGEAVVNSLIPLRGLVREVSGAAGAQRRLDAAINAGVARRGYLRGLAVSRGCRLPAPPVTPPAIAK